MSKVLIGSEAFRRRGGLQHRSPLDVDFVMSWEDLQEFSKNESVKIAPMSASHMVGKWDGRIVEIYIAWEGSTNEEILNFDDMERIEINGVECWLPTLDQLYTLKMTHRFKKNSPHFRKTMLDIREMREMGAKIHDQDFFKRREKETLSYKHPKLNMSKKGFFDTDVGVVYTYDHDSLHKAMAVGDRPAYTHYIKDGEEVLCDREMFEACDRGIRVAGVLEEALVLALERSQIPFDFEPNPDKSFRKALMKVCTSITSGWFREWAWEHYEEVVAMYDALESKQSYVDKFGDALDAGVVIPFEE